MDAEVAKQKFGVASFEMSLEVRDDRIEHQEIYWEYVFGEAGKRNESRVATLEKQRNSGQTSMITFNVQYVPSTWKDSPFTNIYLKDYVEFFTVFRNGKNLPSVTFEGTNYDTMTPSYLR